MTFRGDGVGRGGSSDGEVRVPRSDLKVGARVHVGGVPGVVERVFVRVGLEGHDSAVDVALDEVEHASEAAASGALDVRPELTLCIIERVLLAWRDGVHSEAQALSKVRAYITPLVQRSDMSDAYGCFDHTADESGRVDLEQEIHAHAERCAEPGRGDALAKLLTACKVCGRQHEYASDYCSSECKAGFVEPLPRTRPDACGIAGCSGPSCMHDPDPRPDDERGSAEPGRCWIDPTYSDATCSRGTVGCTVGEHEPERSPTEELVRAADRAMHVVWTAAVGSTGYDKRAWQALERAIWALKPRSETASLESVSAAYDQGATGERARIVAWIRQEVERMRGECGLEDRAIDLDGTADDIERGEHQAVPEKGEEK